MAWSVRLGRPGEAGKLIGRGEIVISRGQHALSSSCTTGHRFSLPATRVGALRTSRSARRGQLRRVARTCARTAGVCAVINSFSHRWPQRRPITAPLARPPGPYIYTLPLLSRTSSFAAVRAVCRAEDRMRAASGTSLRGDPGAAFVLVFSPLRPEGAPGAKINPPSVPRLR